MNFTIGIFDFTCDSKWIKYAKEVSMAEIEVKGSDRKALVDDEFLPLLERFKWRTYAAGGSYVVTSLCGRQVPIHRLIMGTIPQGYVADHINRDRFDNRLCNLRKATPQENKWNSVQKNNSTGFPGVTFEKRSKRYHSRIIVKGKIYHTGSHATPEEASAAREAKAKELFGAFYPGPQRVG